jgi:hypothetical protein
VIDAGAIVLDVHAIKHSEVLGDEERILHPVVGFAGPLGIGFVGGIARQTAGQLKEGSVADGVLVVVTIFVVLYLPS